MSEQVKKKRGGAPKKPLSKKLVNKITVNFSNAEKAKLQELSDKKNGKPIATIIRDILIENKII